MDENHSNGAVAGGNQQVTGVRTHEGAKSVFMVTDHDPLSDPQSVLHQVPQVQAAAVQAPQQVQAAAVQASQQVQAAAVQASQQVQTQAGQAHIPYENTSSMWVSFISKTGQYAPTADECASKVEAVASSVVKEISSRARVSSMSGWRRKQIYKGKRRLYDSEAAEKWRRKKEDPQSEPPDPASQMSFSNPAALSIPARVAIYDMMHENTDFLGYTNDRVFIDNFEKMYKKLTVFERINQGLADPSWDAPGAADTLKGYPAIDNFEIAAIRKRASDCASYKAFYEAKIDILSNPMYLVLRKSDTEQLTEDALAAKAQKLSATSPKLSEYLDAVRRLKRLEAENVSRSAPEFKSLFKVQTADGYDSNLKGQIAFGTVRTSLTVTGPKYANGFLGLKNKNLKDSEEKFTEKDDVTHSGPLEVEASVTLTGVEGKIERKDNISKYGVIKNSADFQVGEIKAYGKIGASIFDTVLEDKDKKVKSRRVDGYVGLEAGVSATALKGKVATSIGVDRYKWYEKFERTKKYKAFKKIKLFDFSGSVSGEALKASAFATARAGQYDDKEEVEVTKDGKTTTEVKDVLVSGAGVKAGVSAALLSGKVKTELTVFGIKLGFQVTGDLGSVGASVGAVAKHGKIGVSLGADLGVGLKLGFYVDFSPWLDVAKEIIAEKTEPVRRMLRRDFDIWCDSKVRWFKDKLGIASNKSVVDKLARDTKDDRARMRLRDIEELAQARRREALDKLSKSDKQVARALNWQNDYEVGQHSLLTEDIAQIEARVTAATAKELADLQAAGANATQQDIQFVDPGTQIEMPDTAFKDGELESGISDESLFGDVNNPFDASLIKQREDINDCYLIATLAGLAITNPDYITNTLVTQDRDNPNLAQVRLYDEKGNPQVIRVSKTKFRGDKRPLWVQLVEKATLTILGRYDGADVAAFRYGKAANKDWAHHTFEAGKAELSELNMGWETVAYMLLFGKSCKSKQIKAAENPKQTLSEAGDEAVGKAIAWLQSHRQVTASTGTFDNGVVNDRLKQKLRSTHVYTVVGTGEQIGGENTLVVRDPYMNIGVEGAFYVTYREFKAYFTNVSTTGV